MIEAHDRETLPMSMAASILVQLMESFDDSLGAKSSLSAVAQSPDEPITVALHSSLAAGLDAVTFFSYYTLMRCENAAIRRNWSTLPIDSRIQYARMASAMMQVKEHFSLPFGQRVRKVFKEGWRYFSIEILVGQVFRLVEYIDKQARKDLGSDAYVSSMAWERVLERHPHFAKSVRQRNGGTFDPNAGVEVDWQTFRDTG